uniref:Putative RNA-dependent DNA polymerase n=1 Tax=Erythrocytic necrosis virus TaxID=1543320 RepID=A0A4D6QRY0_9VIRU|nr:putative RNA-dependent DNA polymerase [Erythrocytic necrosis virus]
MFALAIEPLAIALRSNDAIQGIIRTGLEHKVSLYADDLLLFISNPDTSLPRALSVLKKFGSISGYKLNLGKSEPFPVNKAALKCSFTSSQFRIVRDQFTYLGVKVTRKYSNLFQENVVTLADSLKQSFTFWNSLPLSLIGRINVIKNECVAQIVYIYFNVYPFLFQNLFLFHWIKHSCI